MKEGGRDCCEREGGEEVSSLTVRIWKDGEVVEEEEEEKGERNVE